MSRTQFELIYVTGSQTGESVPLDTDELTIGRSRSNDITMNDPLVSRQHISITVSAGKVMANDLGSSHGTFLNDKRIRGSVSLSSGDILQVGETKFRFSAPDISDDEKTGFVDMDDSDYSEGDATQFAGASSAGLSETGFMPVSDGGPEDSFDKTRVLDEGQTRLMDGKEMRGLKATRVPKKSRLKAVLAGMLVLLALLGAMKVMSPASTDSSIKAGFKRYEDSEYGFTVQHPSNWRRNTAPGALIVFSRVIAKGKPPVALNIYAEKSTSYATTGLQYGFEAYAETIMTRHSGAKIDGKTVKKIRDVTTVLYGFSSKAVRGKGLYMLSGNELICIECVSPRANYGSYAKQFSSILKTFRLDGDQKFIDFPLPNESTRRTALAAPARLADTAKHDLEVGKELIKTSTIRPSNNFIAVQTLKRCMTRCAALGTKPEFYAEAAKTLAEAERQFVQAIRDQKFNIKLAEEQRNVEAAYWESMKLAQMIPDKTHPDHQFAARRVKRYGKRIKDR